MKKLIILWLFLPTISSELNGQPAYSPDPVESRRIDSLVWLLSTARRDWGIYSDQLIEIGRPAIPTLLKVLNNPDIPQWSRRTASMTLRHISDESLIQPCLKILLNENEDMRIRNQVTGILRNYDLKTYKNELQALFIHAPSDLQYNTAVLLLNADADLAYSAFENIYKTHDYYGKKQAIAYMTELRPETAEYWYLEAIKSNDWLTATYGMEQLILLPELENDDLIELYELEKEDEETRWRITAILRSRNNKNSIPFLLQALQDSS